jgi:hypothetical protein
MQSSYSNSNLNGTAVLYYQGASFVLSGGVPSVSEYTAEVAQITGNGTSGATFNVEEVQTVTAGTDCSSSNSCSLTTGSDVGGTQPKPVSFSSNGRATAGKNGGAYLYFYDNNSAYLMNTDTTKDGVALGEALPQSSTSAPVGDFIEFGIFKDNPLSDESQGLFDFNNGTITGVQDDSAQEYTQYAQPLVGPNNAALTYTPGPRTNGELGISNGGNQVDCVVASTTETICLPAQSTPNIAVLLQ